MHYDSGSNFQEPHTAHTTANRNWQHSADRLARLLNVVIEPTVLLTRQLHIYTISDVHGRAQGRDTMMSYGGHLSTTASSRNRLQVLYNRKFPKHCSASHIRRSPKFAHIFSCTCWSQIESLVSLCPQQYAPLLLILHFGAKRCTLQVGEDGTLNDYFGQIKGLSTSFCFSFSFRRSCWLRRGFSLPQVSTVASNPTAWPLQHQCEPSPLSET